MIKYLISLIFFLFLFSCNELNLNNVSDVVENSTNKIEEIIDNKKEDKKEKKQSNNKQTKDNIFYYVGEPYFIEGVSYTCLLYTYPSPRDQRGYRVAGWG